MRKGVYKIEEAAPRRVTIQSVAEALAEDRVRLAYQPVVRAGTDRRLAFYEGLARLIDRSGNTIPAGDFMPLIENHPLCRALDCAALKLGLETLESTPDIRLSINLSPRTIGCEAWLDTLDEGLASAPDIAERLIVEITEGSAMVEPEPVRAFMAGCQARGISFALDDFGAGQTSFRYLREFRFDMLKIDGQFARNISNDPDNRALITAMVGMARHFEMFTVAEHVTNPADAACLAELGVDCLQGYHFGAPSRQRPWETATERARIA